MSKPLNTRQKKFCDNYVKKGLSISESVRRAGYSVKSGRVEDACSYGCKLLKQDRVIAYLSKLREKQFSRDLLSVSEKRAYLARALRTPIGELDEASDLVQEMTYNESANGSSKKVRGVDKLRALELDSRIAGDFFSDRQPHATNAFQFIIQLGKMTSETLANGESASLPSPALRDANEIIEADAELVAP